MEAASKRGKKRQKNEHAPLQGKRERCKSHLRLWDQLRRVLCT